MSDEEKSLWEQAKRSIKPLKKSGRLHLSPPKKRVVIHTPYRPLEGFTEQFLKTIEDKKSVCKRVSRIRKIIIDARLDLHGLTRDRAYARLETFLSTAQQRGHLWVLIITGKGNLSGDQETGGVLQRSIPAWLDSCPLVSGYSTANPQDGGNGALYVRVKRRKD